MSVINIPLSFLLLQVVPEQIGVITMAYALSGIPFRWLEILLLSVVLAFTTYLLFRADLLFGIPPVLFHLILLFLFLILIGKKDVNVSLFAVLMSNGLLYIFRYLSLTIILPFFHTPVPVQSMFLDAYEQIYLAAPQVILLFLTAIIVPRLKTYLFNLTKQIKERSSREKTL